MNIIPAKVRCSVSGHRWRQVTWGLKKGAPMLVCERCHDTGWLV